MVQFIFTPWRNRAELLRVRSQFYPSHTTTTTAAATTADSPPWRTPQELCAIKAAIARVFMWVHRGHCPHVIESTALLMSAIVLDENAATADAISGAAVRASYLMGFTRFVTGLLDSHQEKARKLSMYGVAKTIGLPAAFVELRHQGTHEPMPSLNQLRPAARRALGWIWEFYWRNLLELEEVEVEVEEVGDEGKGGTMSVAMREISGGGGVDKGDTTAVAAAKKNNKASGREQANTATTTTKTPQSTRSNGLQERMCRAALMGYLQREEGDVGSSAAKEGLMRQLQQWDNTFMVMKILEEIGDSTRDQGLLLRAVKLSREILGRPAEENPDEAAQGEGEWRLELANAREESDRVTSVSGGSSSLGKRKKGADQENGDEGRDRARTTGWVVWEGPWVPRPIGII